MPVEAACISEINYLILIRTSAPQTDFLIKNIIIKNYYTTFDVVPNN